MEKLLSNLKKKRGFTLVEVIVVLIIIAILAAILLPSLTGYIDKANEKAVIAEARSAVVAAQTLGSEAYGEDRLPAFLAADAASIKAIKDLAELATDGSVKISVIYDGGKVKELHYDDGSRSVTYNGSIYTVDATYVAITNETVA